MPWVKLDDGFATHPKVIGLRDRTFRVHVAALCYASQHLTDGRIPGAALKTIGATWTAVAELVTAGLWEPTGPDGSHQIHDWSDYQRTAAQVAHWRQTGQERAARSRERNNNRSRERVRPEVETEVETEEPLTTTPTPRCGKPDSSPGLVDPVIADAIELLVRQAETDQRRAGKPIANPAQWRTAVAARLQHGHHGQLRYLHHEMPSLTAVDLAVTIGGGSPFDLVDRHDELVAERRSSTP